MYRILLGIVFLLVTYVSSSAQIDSMIANLNFEMDFRFRVEQDWNSKKSDGTERIDRTRFRYRLRAGFTYENAWYSFGTRIRTGDPRKQQDPQLTLGKGLKEFGTLPIGFEKAYFQGINGQLKFWLGKNTYPFRKNNELFWSDNVFPEGIYLQKDFRFKSGIIDKLGISGGHFILSSNDGSLFDDAYLQGVQTSVYFDNDVLEIFPSLYVFRNVPNIPDGNHEFVLDYTIAHIGSELKLLKEPQLTIKLDYYQNLEDYEENEMIADDLINEKTAYTIGARYGHLNADQSWMFEFTYARLQRYSIVDFMAQNDWARWDYSAFDSPDGRLSNYQGIEAVVAYAINEQTNLVMKYYLVEQLIPFGITKETGSRIRLDLNVKI